MELVFKYILWEKISTQEIDELWLKFIEHIESYQALWGGGLGADYIQGGLTFRESKEKVSNLRDLEMVLDEFYEKNPRLFKSLTYKEYED